MIIPIPGDEAWHPLVDRGARLESMVALDGADVREGFLDVGDLHRFGIGDRLASRFLLEQRDHAHQVFAPAVADIIERVRAGAPTGFLFAIIGRRPIEAGEDASDDIVDVSEVAAHLSAIEQGQRLARVKRLQENPHGHVWPSPRAVDREEPAGPSAGFETGWHSFR